jgi:hypothetical protein
VKMGLFDIFKPKESRRAIPYDIYDPRGRAYIDKRKEEGWFQWWYIIPIGIIIVAMLAVMDIGPFKGEYGQNATTTTGPVCGDKTCQSQFENINSCPQDCDPNYKGGPTNIWDFIKNNWIALLIIGIVIWWFILRKPSEYSGDKAPKIYTLEECRQTAEAILRKKGFDNYLPTFHYMNRPDIYAYRYLYKEDTYEGINTHKGGGFKEHDKAYFMIEIGYDNELNYFEMTTLVDRAMQWIEEKIGAGIKASMREYRTLREKSEQPMTKVEHDIRRDQEKYGDIAPFYYTKGGKRYPRYSSPQGQDGYQGYEER